MEGAWKVQASEFSQNTVNPIRRIVDTMKISPNPEKELIKLTIGDPTVFGNLEVAQECVDAVARVLSEGKHNGYTPSVGLPAARAAVAEYVSTESSPVSMEDVVLTGGCSQSLDLVITLLANPGQNILIPRPGFPLYKCLAESLGIETRYYDLKPENGWNIDLRSLEDAIDEDTVAVLVNSPSNPCGGVFKRDHMTKIISLCEKYKIPIISDEVYEHVVYNDEEHIPFADVAGNVPVFTVSSISKRFLVPGWRLGWVVIHDKGRVLSAEIRTGLTSLTQRILGPCSLIQGALPEILKSTPQSSFDKTNNIIQENSNMVYDAFCRIPGLNPIKPTGAMYMMVGVELEQFPEFSSDVDFTERLMKEESVFCLPASAFSFPGFVRVVLSVPTDKAIEACGRLSVFCKRHYQHPPSPPSPETSSAKPITSMIKKPRTLQRITTNLYLNR